ncbi:hypothetical protein Plhal304r1_c049g0131311 [Plasmopara halstedii]
MSCIYDECIVIVELPTTVHERTVRTYEFLIVTGNGRSRGSITASTAALPNKEADAIIDPTRLTFNRTPLPALRTVVNWVTLAVKVGRSQNWASLEDAAQWWSNYSGIQYILLLKINPKGIQMQDMVRHENWAQ